MESAIPPSYEEATTRNHWSLVADYIESSDLCSASLVSKAWHDIFAPCLWGNPASHFGTENDRVYGKHTCCPRKDDTVRLTVIFYSRLDQIQAHSASGTFGRPTAHPYAPLAPCSS